MVTPSGIADLESVADPVVRIERYLNDAYELWREIELFELDRKLEEDDKWTIHYAVDTDVVMMYIEPFEMGPTRGARKGYGVVFHDDEEDNCTALASAVSRFLFFDLASSQRPFLLMHGHDAEIRGIYDSIHRRVEDDKYEKRVIRSTLIHQLEQARNGSLTSIQELDAQFPLIMDHLFLDDSDTVRLDRFKRLLANRSVSRLSHALTNAPEYQSLLNTDPALRMAFDVPKGMADLAIESKYRTDWDDRLDKRVHTAKPDYSALARIELLNEKLAPFKHKIVLITGDRSMINASKAYYPKEGDPDSFYKKYIRHPRAFLSAPEVLAPFEGVADSQEGHSPVLLSKWLKYLLALVDNRQAPKTADRLPLDHEKLKREIGDLGDIQSFADRIRNQWDQHVDRLSEYYGVADSLARSTLQKLSDQGESDRFTRLLDRLLTEKIEHSRESWGDLLGVMINAGYVFLEAGRQNLEYVKRNAPPVLLTRFSGAYNLVKQITTTRDDPDLTREAIRKLDRLEPKETSDYMKALAYSVLFASRDRWLLASDLADHALELVQQNGGERVVAGEVISGREAYFLKAISARMTASSVDEIIEAKDWLTLARTALAAEQDDDENWVELRFDCEEVSQSLACHLFDQFGDAVTDNQRSEDDLKQIADKYAVIWSRLDEVRDPWIRHNLERSICVNLIMIHAISPSHEIMPNLVQKAFDTLEENVASKIDGYKLPESFLVQAVRIYGASVFGRLSRRLRRHLRDRILHFEHVFRTDPEATLVMPYDGKRYSELFRLAQINMLRSWPT